MSDRIPLIDPGTEMICPQKYGMYEYLVQRHGCRMVGVQDALVPVCPESDGAPWELFSVTIAGDTVFMYWKRWKS